MAELPIDAVLPQLLATLAARPNAVLQAPPGAGKTTRVPLALLDARWRGDGRIVVLEPRRVAARAAARRMAALLGEEVGGRVGYRVRLDARVGPATRVEVVTDGVLLRRLQADPALDGIAALLFDELHERSLEVDLALALALEAQAAFRPDLRLLAMSATLDGAGVARLMGEAPVVASAGRAFPVEVRHLGRPDGPDPAPATAAAVRRALAEAAGDVLVFLPGAAEIARTERLLAETVDARRIALQPLYGDLSAAAQDAALRPAADGRRRVVLATDIAETSLTIEGIAIVVDAGLARRPRFDPASGMSRLTTERISLASAEQRRGRAGRLGPGVCYRLWDEAETRGLLPYRRPEILDADLAPLALQLAAWGAEPGQLAWLDPPPAAAYAQARDLLAALGALDAVGRITAHGREMAGFATHPRLAHMLLAAGAHGLEGLACEVAALLAERDLLRGGTRDADLRRRLEALREGGAGIDRGAAARVRQQAAQWRRRLGAAAEGGTVDDVGLLLALAWPERVARRRGPGRFRLAQGRGARLAEDDPLATADWLAVAELDAGEGDGRIRLAAPLAAADLERAFAHRLSSEERVLWDERSGAAVLARRRLAGNLVLEERRLPPPADERTVEAMLHGIRRLGLAALPWDAAAHGLRARVALMARLDGADAGWPDLSDAALLARLEEWLAPDLPGIARREQLARLDLAAALARLVDGRLRRRLESDAPTHVEVASGSRIAVDYAVGDVPVLAVRLQEMFGCAATPRIAGGRQPLLLHLLSPARRPVQVTQDLAGFWRSGYQEVRKELRARYPKHAWPEDPATALPTRGVRRRAS